MFFFYFFVLYFLIAFFVVVFFFFLLNLFRSFTFPFCRFQYVCLLVIGGGLLLLL